MTWTKDYYLELFLNDFSNMIVREIILQLTNDVSNQYALFEDLSIDFVHLSSSNPCIRGSTYLGDYLYYECMCFISYFKSINVKCCYRALKRKKIFETFDYFLMNKIFNTRLCDIICHASYLTVVLNISHILIMQNDKIGEKYVSPFNYESVSFYMPCRRVKMNEMMHTNLKWPCTYG